jgi:hypothetical protein
MCVKLYLNYDIDHTVDNVYRCLMKDEFFSFSWIRSVLYYLICMSVTVAIYLQSTFLIFGIYAVLNLYFGAYSYLCAKICIFNKVPCTGNFPEIPLSLLGFFFFVYIC